MRPCYQRAAPCRRARVKLADPDAPDGRARRARRDNAAAAPSSWFPRRGARRGGPLADEPHRQRDLSRAPREARPVGRRDAASERETRQTLKLPFGTGPLLESPDVTLELQNDIAPSPAVLSTSFASAEGVSPAPSQQPRPRARAAHRASGSPACDRHGGCAPSRCRWRCRARCRSRRRPCGWPAGAAPRPRAR